MAARRTATSSMALALLLSCGDGTGPATGTPGIAFLTGDAQTDTVDATLAQALVVEVRDTRWSGSVRSLARRGSGSRCRSTAGPIRRLSSSR